MLFPSVRYSSGLPKQTFSFGSKKEEDREGPSSPTREKADSGTLTPPEAGFEFKSKRSNIYTHIIQNLPCTTFMCNAINCVIIFYYFQMTSEDFNVSFFSLDFPKGPTIIASKDLRHCLSKTPFTKLESAWRVMEWTEE